MIKFTNLFQRVSRTILGSEVEQSLEERVAQVLGMDHNSSTEETDAPAASWQNSSKGSKATRQQL